MKKGVAMSVVMLAADSQARSSESGALDPPSGRRPSVSYMMSA